VNTLAGGEYYFRGSVKGNQMEGKISLVFGTIQRRALSGFPERAL
jgi:hypothetical protein